jgi:hypothetical protein
MQGRFKDTLTSSAETEYAIVCPSAMRVIPVALDVVCVHFRVQREFSLNGYRSAADANAAPNDTQSYGILSRT